MREPPPHVTEADLLGAVREAWLPDADAAHHLPVGFGAHHWSVSAADGARLFVTLDALGSRHTAATLEGAYAGAAALAASGLEFVVPCLPACSGRFTVPFARGALSATPWVPGRRPGDGEFPHRPLAETSALQLSRLHAATPPAGLPVWQPLVSADFATSLATRLRTTWDSGPFGERARSALHGHLDDVLHWIAAYHRLAEEARDHPWVPTHGEPHTRNMLLTQDGPVLVDWESLKLAPRERDLRPLIDSGHADLATPYWPMVEMFDLEWRLDEVSQYADWFEAAHTGSESDEVALGGLLSELARPKWSADQGTHR